MLTLKTIVSDLRGRLVCHCRPEGCLFSHSGRSMAQEVPSVCFWRESLPVQGSSIWPGLGAEDVHKMHGCCSGPFEAPGHLCAQLPGRLAHSGPFQGVSELSLHHIRALGLRTNTKKSVLGVHLDSVQMQARLAPDRISGFNVCLARFKLGHHVSVSTCRRLLGRMAAASPVLPLGLLPMRPFLWWMRLLRICSTGPATRLIRVSRSCFRTLLIWRDPTFLRSGVRIGAIHRQWQAHSRINDRLGHGLRGQTSARGLDRRVPLLESSSRSVSFEPRRQLSVKTEAQTGEVDVVAQIWYLFGESEVELFASQESSQCPFWFSLSSRGHASLFPSSSLCFRWGWKASHTLSCPSFENICGPFQTLEKIFAVLWGAWPSFTSQHSCALY